MIQHSTIELAIGVAVAPTRTRGPLSRRRAQKLGVEVGGPAGSAGVAHVLDRGDDRLVLEQVELVDFTARPGRADGRLGRSHVGWTVTDMYVTQARAVVRGAA